jgi:hypothetical protein
MVEKIDLEEVNTARYTVAAIIGDVGIMLALRMWRKALRFSALRADFKLAQ